VHISSRKWYLYSRGLLMVAGGLDFSFYFFVFIILDFFIFLSLEMDLKPLLRIALCSYEK